MVDGVGPQEADVHHHLAAEVQLSDVDLAWEPHDGDAPHAVEAARTDDRHADEVARDDDLHADEVALDDIPDEHAVGLRPHVHRHAETGHHGAEERLEDWLLARCVSLQQDRGGVTDVNGHR